MKPASHPRQGKSIAGTLLLTLLWLPILLLLLPAGCCCALSLEQLFRERIYEADVNTVNPELEGKLVKLKITEIQPLAPVQDPLFGIRGNFLVLSRQVFDSALQAEGTQLICGDDGDVLLSEGMMDGIRSCQFSPAKMRSGAFTLLHAGRFLEPEQDAPLLPLPPREQWPAVLRQKGAVPEPGVIIWRKSEHPDDIFAHVRFRALPPGVLSYPLFVVARQHGNTLDMSDKHACQLLWEDFGETHHVGHSNPLDGLELAFSLVAAVFCTPLGWALLTLYLWLRRGLMASGRYSRHSALAAAALQCLLVCLCGWQGMYGAIVEPLAWALPLALLLGLCLRGARPRFGARCTALLYLPVIILFLSAASPIGFRWEVRLIPAALAVLCAWGATRLTRRPV